MLPVPVHKVPVYSWSTNSGSFRNNQCNKVPMGSLERPKRPQERSKDPGNNNFVHKNTRDSDKNRYTCSILDQTKRYTQKTRKKTRQEPCDWPASRRTCFWLESGQVHLDLSTLSIFQMLFYQVWSSSEAILVH